jgi:UDP-N-acetylmuramoylalanine--D-glutamate ligase
MGMGVETPKVVTDEPEGPMVGASDVSSRVQARGPGVSTLRDLLDDRRVLVLGFGVSGQAALELVGDVARPAALAVADEGDPASWDPDRRSRWNALAADGIETYAQPADPAFVDAWDCLIVSPGFRPWHPWLERARAHGKTVLPEFELGYLAAPPGIWIGITGTNGKTTTTRWVGQVLMEAGLPTVVGGNIGEPVSRLVRSARPGSYYVIELSSFQLYGLRVFRPDVAVLLNVDQDHLDWHGSVADYVAAKLRLFQHQRPDDWAVVNGDERHLWEAYRSLPSRLLSFGLSGRWYPGAGVQDDWLMLWWGRTYPIGPVRLLRTPWPFMVANLLAVVLTGVALRLTLPQIRASLGRLTAPPHRLEWVARIRDVDFYDDSKATNVHAVRWALASMTRPVVLIAGGQAKGQDLRPLRSLLAEKARAVVLIGEDRASIRTAWADVGVPLVDAGDMEEAVRVAFRMARPGDAVLLSPACASFDMFQGYAHRGDAFRKAVLDLKRVLEESTE